MTCHARGVARHGRRRRRSALPAQWPPPAPNRRRWKPCTPRLADAGYEYGPTFQGLRAAWRVGDDVYAEVALPDEHVDAPAGSASTRPCSTRHCTAGSLDKDPGTAADLPFSWYGVRLGARPGRPGPSPDRVRPANRDCASTSSASTANPSSASRNSRRARLTVASWRAPDRTGRTRCSRSTGSPPTANSTEPVDVVVVGDVLPARRGGRGTRRRSRVGPGWSSSASAHAGRR